VNGCSVYNGVLQIN
jgi:hypothetical protein